MEIVAAQLLVVFWYDSLLSETPLSTWTQLPDSQVICPDLESSVKKKVVV